ncbi:MAG: hypothetical protein K2O39_08070 [Clostridiales bacterium]|nr:hypothetical protein [Clostridiales bacterium]
MNTTETTETLTKEVQAKIEREVEFLKQLHQAAQMGRDTLEHVNNNIGPGELRTAVEKDIFDYSDVCAQITRKLEERGEQPKSVGKIARTMASMMINFKINDETPESEVAKMIIDGTTKGVTESIAKLSEFADIDNDVLNIGYRLLWVEQKNIDEMRRFLHN